MGARFRMGTTSTFTRCRPILNPIHAEAPRLEPIPAVAGLTKCFRDFKIIFCIGLGFSIKEHILV